MFPSSENVTPKITCERFGQFAYHVPFTAPIKLENIVLKVTWSTNGWMLATHPVALLPTHTLLCSSIHVNPHFWGFVASD
uniref:Uncharacterized protein n=1 Tax=Glossina morsitans morsitans TaxID=37546 RepID=A0A1B0FCX3_GLOMM